VKLARLTNGRGSLSWPSASSRDWKGAPASRVTPEGYNARLDEAVILYGQAAPASSSLLGSRQGLWATPKTPTGGPETAKRKQELGRTASGGGDLASQTLEQWGSPRTGIRADTRFSYDRGKHNIEEQAGASMKGGGKLNPRWVETLMGLPIGWTMPSCTSPQTIAPTSCDSSAMESCLPPQSEPSEFFLGS